MSKQPRSLTLFLGFWAGEGLDQIKLTTQQEAFDCNCKKEGGFCIQKRDPPAGVTLDF